MRHFPPLPVSSVVRLQLHEMDVFEGMKLDERSFLNIDVFSRSLQIRVSAGLAECDKFPSPITNPGIVVAWSKLKPIVTPAVVLADKNVDGRTRFVDDADRESHCLQIHRQSYVYVIW